MSIEQANRLKELISQDIGRVGFVTKIFDAESKKFASQILGVFKEVGWEIVLPINETLLQDFDGDTTVWAAPNSKFQLRAHLVCTAFNEIDITCGPQEIRDNAVSINFQEDVTYVVVDSWDGI